MFDQDNLRHYFEIRNGLKGAAFSSKLAPWLALGCVSPRQVYNECNRYERERGISNKSTYWMTFELLVRDFFLFQHMKYGDKVFHLDGPHKVLPRGWSWRKVS